MELVHLRTFLAVLEHRGFRNAARHLYLSQPAVSRQVAELERSVGIPLLHRMPSGVEPTPAGQALAEWGQVLLDDHAQAIRATRAQDHEGELVVGVTPGGAGELTSPLLRHLARAYPRVRFRTREFGLSTWPDPTPGAVDLVLGRDPVGGDDVRATVLLTETMALAVPRRQPESEAPRLTLEQAFELPFARIAPSVRPVVGAFWTVRDRRGSTDLRFVGRSSGAPASVGRAVGRGDGVAFATPMVVRQFASASPSSTLVPVDGAPAVRVALASALQDHRPLVDAVHREVAWVARRLGPLVLPELAAALPV